MSAASMEALEKGRQRRWASFEERFAAQIAAVGECMVWTGANVRGYGFIERGGAKVMAHRVSFEAENGPIPAGMQIDHVCRNRSCVRASHLRLASNKENAENKTLPSTNTSGHRGVSRYRDGVRWVAQVKHNGKTHHLGIFGDATAAAEAARSKRVELFTHNDADRPEVSS